MKSELGIALARILKETGITPSELSRLSGTNKRNRLQNSWLSRVINGKQKFVPKEKMEKLIKPFDKIDQARLIAAHAKDETFGLCPDMVKVTIRD